MIARDVRQHTNLLLGINDPRGIPRIRKRDGTRLFGNQRFEHISSREDEAVIGFCGDRFDHDIVRCGEAAIVCIERLGNENLLTGIACEKERPLQRLAAPVRDDDIFHLIGQIDAFIVLRDTLAERLPTVRVGISKHFYVSLFNGFHEDFRRLDIGLTDVEMVNLYTPLFCLICVWNKFANRRCLQIITALRCFHPIITPFCRIARFEHEK